ncbi:MAG: hypothetical protein CR997_12750 [Acidobacteria bacterium]|nr:MAG: hypothetical protein CR997_12750 [Acidobacteriota bacterium]
MKQFLCAFCLFGSILSFSRELKTLHLPHFTTKGGNWTTEFALTNSSGESRAAEITAYDAEGDVNGTWSLSLPAMGGVQGSIEDLCPGLTAETGSLSIRTDEPTISGLMKFTYSSTGGSSSLPLIEETSNYLVLPLLENNAKWVSGFAFVNSTTQTSGLKLTLKSFEGITVQTVYRELAGHGKLVAMLDDLFNDPIPTHVFLEVESEQPLTGFALSFSDQNRQIVAVPAKVSPAFSQSAEKQLLNDTFRIDIQEIEATLDFHPNSGLMEGRAVLSFYMLPGQTKALVHLSEHLRNRIESIRLNGESLDDQNQNDVQLIYFDGSSQPGLEFQRELSPWKKHELVMTYEKNDQAGLVAFYTDVNDIYGVGNETFWPTINRPSELARHRLTFNVHDNQPYHFIGSGLVEEQNATNGQSWTLDTERPIASYTVMFFLGAQDTFDLESRIVNGIPVNIMTSLNHVQLTQEAFNILENWLPQLEEDLGPFPMPRGLSLFITSGGGGMEYFGGSITSNWALQHEIFHMYYACSTIADTYRDSWWDEAICVWYEEGPGAFDPIVDFYSSNIVSGRSPIDVGFDTRAYYEGGEMFEHLSRTMGGREALIAFLSYTWGNYRFSPFTTQDLLRILKNYNQTDYFDEFQQWLYTDANKAGKNASVCPYHCVQLPEAALLPRSEYR